MNTKLLSHVWRVLIVLVFSLSLAGVPASPVSAAGVHLYVATSGSDAGPNDCLTESSPCLTVAYAISQATSDDIIHIAAGTYVENIILDKSMSLLGAGMNQTILDGNGNGKVVNVNAAVNVSLTDLTIQNGYDITSWGGGIYIWGGSLSLTRVKVTNNTAQWGGGISSGAPVSMDDCVISGNNAMSGGGGGMIANNGTTVSITDSTISGNSASATDTNGGGLFIDGSVLTLSGLTISGNNANGSGGGIHVQGTNTKNLTNVTISENTAYEGGGIFSSSIDTIDIVNSTIANNYGNSGSGIKNYGSIRFLNTIVANNTGGEDCINFPTGTTWTSLGYNLESGSTCGFTQTGDLQNIDPQLGALGNNGGLTQTHALPAGSPAIDAGTNSDCPTHDQRGVTRPFGAFCDIGAYEQNKGSLTTRSVGSHDGWILESAEASNVGGTMNAAATTFNLGDEAGDKQYRAVLSFNTASLPDTAVITKVTLKIKRPATGYLVGNNSPFTWGLGLKVDGCRTFFGTTAALQLGDFNFNNATNCKLLAGTFGGAPVAYYWYSANILSTAFARINKTGTTQFRLRFAKDDNDDGAADYMKFYSGNFATADARPMLVIEYYVP